jgi:ribosomal protein L37E
VAEQPVAEHILCRRCRHYKVSWDPNAPHACEAMGFKSQKLPSLVVYEASGIDCQMFAPKPQKP